MLTKDFAYHLPEELIARYPAVERSASRLLVLDPLTQQISDCIFTDVLEMLQPGDLLVLNNSKVIKARMYGNKESGGKIEILIARILDAQTAWAHVHASKTPKLNSWLHFANNIRAQVQEYDADKALFKLHFASTLNIKSILEQQGLVPIPPYFNRAADTADLQRYQTVYAVSPGSIAAPTAGLHFTEILLQQIAQRGIEIARLTLHVGAGTFQPVRVASIADHKMHSEYMEITPTIADQINVAKQNGKRIIAVGTTTVRALESATHNGVLLAKQCDTNIFITPGFQFKMVDAMITNFHVPESTLLMLVAAFAGKENIFKAYQHAINNKYRFYSYGDAMFITRKKNAI